MVIQLTRQRPSFQQVTTDKLDSGQKLEFFFVWSLCTTLKDYGINKIGSDKKFTSYV